MKKMKIINIVIIEYIFIYQVQIFLYCLIWTRKNMKNIFILFYLFNMDNFNML